MKIQLLSDLHNEFYRNQPIPFIEATDADLVILAGDIDLGLAGLRWAQEESERLDKPVLYVAGNHEFYDRDIGLKEEMRAFAAASDRLHYLENDSLDVDGVRFLGCTLWTDYRAAGDPELSMLEVGQMLTDHRVISVGSRYFDPADALALHLESRAWLVEKLAEPFEGKRVVVSHHAPHLQCKHPRFQLNGIATAFLSDLSSLVNQADLWCYGHTHSNFDRTIDGCRVVSNQRGYPDERVDGYRPGIQIEV